MCASVGADHHSSGGRARNFETQTHDPRRHREVLRIRAIGASILASAALWAAGHAATRGSTASIGCHDLTPPPLQRAHPVVARLVLELGDPESLQQGREVDAEAAAQALLEPVPTS